MPRHSPLFQFRHGDHSCIFYHSGNALMEVLTPYIAEGLRRGERCFVQKPHISTRLLSDLHCVGFDTTDLVLRGVLEVHSENEVYVQNGRFDPGAMMDMLMRSLNEALRRGFTAFRTAGNLSWALEGRNVSDRLLEYEGLVNGYYPGRPAIGLCQYDTNAFSPPVIESVIKAHDLHVSDLLPSSPSYSGISIRSGNYWFDIVADKVKLSPEYHYVVQRRRPSDFVGWGVAPSYDRARAEAERIVRHCDN
jgi:hypothetical protein